MLNILTELHGAFGLLAYLKKRINWSRFVHIIRKTKNENYFKKLHSFFQILQFSKQQKIIFCNFENNKKSFFAILKTTKNHFLKILKTTKYQILTEIFFPKFQYFTYFGMVTTQGNQLFANGTTPIVFTFTISGVWDYAFHFVTTWRATIGVSTLTGMNQALQIKKGTIKKCYYFFNFDFFWQFKPQQIREF